VNKQNFLAYTCWILGVMLIYQAMRTWRDYDYHQGMLQGMKYVNGNNLQPEGTTGVAI